MLSDWWNGVELWVSGLAFPLQFALVITVLAPICLVLAWLIDRVVDHAAALFGPAGDKQPPRGEEPVADEAEVAETGPDADPDPDPRPGADTGTGAEEAARPRVRGERVPAESGGGR